MLIYRLFYLKEVFNKSTLFYREKLVLLPVDLDSFLGTREMAQQLQALTVLPKDQGLFPSIHMVTQQLSVTPVSGRPLFWPLFESGTCVILSNTCIQTPTHINNNKIKLLFKHIYGNTEIKEIILLYKRLIFCFCINTSYFGTESFLMI